VDCTERNKIVKRKVCCKEVRRGNSSSLMPKIGSKLNKTKGNNEKIRWSLKIDKKKNLKIRHSIFNKFLNINIWHRTYQIL
jgi:hypothetical protein